MESVNNVIEIEFKRWTSIKEGEVNGNRYRISRFCPNGKFKCYTAAVYLLGEWIATEHALEHPSLESAESYIRMYIELFMSANYNALGMDY